MFNVKDIPVMENEIKEAFATGKDETIDEVMQKYTGPGVGLVWNDKAEKLELASEWKLDDEGNIKRFDEFGPGVE